MAEYEKIDHVDEKGIKLPNGDRVSITLPKEGHQQYAELVLNGIRVQAEIDADGSLYITTDDADTSFWIDRNGKEC